MNKYLKKLFQIFNIEKYIFLIIAVVVYSSYAYISNKFDGSAVKGRFTVNIGKYHTISLKIIENIREQRNIFFD